jgi:hypothetical protein
LKAALAQGWETAVEQHWEPNVRRSPLPSIDTRHPREDAVFGLVRNVLIVASLFDAFTWQFPVVIFTPMLGPGKWDAAETVLRIVYDIRKALRPAQAFPATPSRMDVSPAAEKRKLTEQEEMQQLRNAMPSMGGAGTAHDPPVKPVSLAKRWVV